MNFRFGLSQAKDAGYILALFVAVLLAMGTFELLRPPWWTKNENMDCGDPDIIQYKNIHLNRLLLQNKLLSATILPILEKNGINFKSAEHIIFDTIVQTPETLYFKFQITKPEEFTGFNSETKTVEFTIPRNKGNNKVTIRDAPSAVQMAQAIPEMSDLDYAPFARDRITYKGIDPNVKLT